MTITSDQRGITLFEIMIILLLLVLITLSCVVTVRKIQKDRRNDYQQIKIDHAPDFNRPGEE